MPVEERAQRVMSARVPPAIATPFQPRSAFQLAIAKLVAARRQPGESRRHRRSAGTQNATSSSGNRCHRGRAGKSPAARARHPAVRSVSPPRDE